ncbi:MAG: hypothetical protein U0793_15815 [Gemmataceae bacterium]
MSDADKAPVNAAIEKVKQATGGTDINLIRQALNNLQTAAHAMSQHLGARGARADAGKQHDRATTGRQEGRRHRRGVRGEELNLN